MCHNFVSIQFYLLASHFNELRNVYIIKKARWYVAGKEWKIDNVEVKIIMFVI